MRLWLLQNETVHSLVLGEGEEGDGGPALGSTARGEKLTSCEPLCVPAAFLAVRPLLFQLFF